jgi:putative transposase
MKNAYKKIANPQCKLKFLGVYMGMRKTRLLQNGAVYHVIAQTNRRELILNSKEIKDMFEEILKRAKGIFRFLVRNFCIMGTHVHLMIEPIKGESLSEIMQWILGVFAKKYNKRFKLMGHVWYDRFKSFIISSFRKFLETFIYITENPVKAGIVGRFDEFPHCGATQMKRGLHDIVEPPNTILKLFLSRLVMPHLLG